jgi:hypothetical protein
MPMLTKTPHIIHISQYAGAIQHVSVKRLTENVLIRNTNRFLESLFRHKEGTRLRLEKSRNNFKTVFLFAWYVNLL